MFGFNEEEHATILENHPSVSSLTIPAGTYAGHDYDQTTVAMWNFAVAHADMPEAWPTRSPSWRWRTTSAWCRSTPPPRDAAGELGQEQLPALSPRRVRYFEEAGITIPDNLRD
jgi:uncharacterized protein